MSLHLSRDNNNGSRLVESKLQNKLIIGCNGVEKSDSKLGHVEKIYDEDKYRKFFNAPCNFLAHLVKIQ